MSCVTLSVLLHELLCISDPQSGLLSLPSIIQCLCRVSARAHARTHAHIPSPPWKACKAKPVITLSVILSFLLFLTRSHSRIIFNGFNRTTLQTLRSVQSRVLIKWLQYWSCVTRALLCCDGRVGRRSDPFDQRVWRVVLSSRIEQHPFVSILHHFSRPSIIITSSEGVELRGLFTSVNRTINAPFCTRHPIN